VLGVAAQEGQVANVYAFCHGFQEKECEFRMLCYRLAPGAALGALQIVERKDQWRQLLGEISREGYFFLDTVTDYATTYKGRIELVMAGFNNRGFLVDAVSLRSELSELRVLIEDARIVKFCYRLGSTLQDIKRDWSAFGVNFFDFELLEKSIGVKKTTNRQLPYLTMRPLNGTLLEELQ
jgi:hypothetical protein